MEPDIIYDQFKNRTEPLIKILGENVSKYPEPLNKLGLEYLRAKNILLRSNVIKGILPNIIFWLEPAFDFENKAQIADRLWLGLLYLGLSYTVRDDLIDNDRKPNVDLLALSNLLMVDSLDLHTSIFPKGSKFWSIYSNSIAECYRSEVWERTSNIFSVTEFSEDFLLMLTRKYAWIAIPSLSAFPLLAEREDMIEPLVMMIKYYCIAHKLLDDLDDWENDLKDRRFNFSSTILFFMLRYQKKGAEQITNNEIRLTMINSNFIETLLKIALNYLSLSLNSIKEINSPFLKIFLEGRIKFLQENIERTRSSGNEARNQLGRIEGFFEKGDHIRPTLSTRKQPREL